LHGEQVNRGDNRGDNRGQSAGIACNWAERRLERCMIRRHPRRSLLSGTSLFLGLAFGVPTAALTFSVAARQADAAGGRGGSATSASASASGSASSAPSPGAGAGAGGAGGSGEEAHDPRVAEVRALIASTLDPTVTPQSLFDVPLTDESALRVEAVRVQALLASIDAGRVLPPTGPAPIAPPIASASASGEAATPVPPTPATTSAEATLWRERIELDRARLTFYQLPKARRDELLAAHEARQEAARPKESAEERRAREVEAERQKALEAARVARSEAERLVSEELARLIGLEATVATAREHFREARTALTNRQDAVLGWQRRVKGAKAASANATESADAVYDALRKDLKSARDDLDKALDDLQSPVSQVPELGADPLASIPPEVSADQVRARRALVAEAIANAKEEEQTLREQRASTLLDEASSLDHERLSLLPSLSVEKRSAITGFSPAGWEQAQAEARQLLLILRYHRQAAADWITHARASRGRGLSWWSTAAVLVPWLLLSWAFSWWRRRSGVLLALADKRLEEDDRAERRVTPSPQRQTLRFFREIRRPLEWLAFFSLLFWLLPPSVRSLLEVELFGSVVRWTLGGALVVDVINALAEGATTGHVRDQESVATLRLRSLRLVGRVSVAFLLVLVLSARLVGQGTLYSWVLSTCWMAAIPIFLILVRWWRETVFERVDRVRKKSRLQEWVLAKRTGWQSFLAAMVGAVQLFAAGTVKIGQRWVSSFNLARRAHAYLFKRELDRLTSAKAHELAHPLDPTACAVMAPDATHKTWISSPADARLAALKTRLATGRGGVVALVGDRGSGKSSLLRELLSSPEGEGGVLIDCAEHPSFESIRERLATEVGPRAPDETVDADHPHKKSTHAPLVLLDEAQVVIKPVIGGLRTFDDVVAFARTRCQDSLWVISIDAVLWPFLARARDTRPMFDDILTLQGWDEEQIGALLNERLEQAGVTASFEDLLEELPASADEFDKQDALTERRLGYVRMLWDHVRGNPGLALEVWRGSLAEDTKGMVRVRSLQVPDGTELESLPDSTLFIFRAILQLAPATADEIVTATRLSSDQVQNALRYAEARGYLRRTEPAHDIVVSWRWLRPVLRLLERRHLLVSQ
jgi:energy-coupling factor transporter ATP-binding protein EcfA2